MSSALAVLIGFFPYAREAKAMASAPPGIVETGAPPFVVQTREAIGLSSSPTDLRMLPDGRLLLIAGRQLAFGDGVRWDVFRQSPTDPLRPGLGAVVDADGQIYVGVPNGCARVAFDANGTWHLAPIVTWTKPGEPNFDMPETMVNDTGDAWFWHSRTGPVVRWRPGESATKIGWTDTFEHVFALSNSHYLSDRPSGRLSRIEGGEMETVMTYGTRTAITCSVPFEPGVALVGTYGAGLHLFDGRLLRPFPGGEALSASSRYTDLCALPDGRFAAAIDNFGIVFFGRNGSVEEVLDRTFEPRVARVKRLLPTSRNTVWALLDDGLAEVAYPTAITDFEPFFGPGLTTVHPKRIDGQLWFLGDGIVYRAAYDASGRLTHVVEDMPGQLFVSALSLVNGLPVIGTEGGAYYRGPKGWLSFAPEIAHLRALGLKSADGRVVYCAENEVGWLRTGGAGIELGERITAPGLSRTHNLPLADGHGSVWLEVGTGKIGRVRIVDGQPTAVIYDARNGVPPSWPQGFVIDGVVRFDFADTFYRFNDDTQRFEVDASFFRQLPGVTTPYGRAGIDGKGRLWLSADGGVRVFERRGGNWVRLPLKIPVGFLPYYYTFEENGVVWMHAQHRLSRFDPDVVTAAEAPVRALITHVTVGDGRRLVFPVDGRLPPLPYEDHSIVVHFVANSTALGASIQFQVRLGGESNWTSNGNTGAAVFNRLKEGHYELFVRPVVGETVGEPAKLTFEVRPPWFRSNAAMVGYVLAGLGCFGLAVWLVSLLERREKTRLERLVAQRTRELNQSNAQLARQLDEIRKLTQAIEQSPVALFITRPDGIIEFANQRACEQTGLGIEELVGVSIRQLRSELVTAETLAAADDAVRKGGSWRGQLANRRPDGKIYHVQATVSPIRGPDREVAHHLLLEEDITQWLAEQDRRRRLEAQLFQAQKLESIGTLAGGIAHDFNNILTGIMGFCELAQLSADAGMNVAEELREIRSASRRAKDLVSQILAFSRQSDTKLVPLDLARPIEEAIKLVRASTPATIEIHSHIESGFVRADPTQIHQAVINLCTNSVHAIDGRPGRIDVSLHRMIVDAELAGEISGLAVGRYVCLTVADTGHGMEKTTLDRIFDPFFTTKKPGEGTGLGLAIVQGVVANHKGALRVRSTVNHGTTFDLFFPSSDETTASVLPNTPSPRGAGQGILVLDDESAVTSFASARLKQYGYHAAVFNDPRAALSAFLAGPERFDAVVSDLTMPHLTGVDVLLKIRSVRPQFPAVIITGHGRDAALDKLRALPCCVILPKPFDGEDLIRAVGQALNAAADVPSGAKI